MTFKDLILQDQESLESNKNLNYGITFVLTLIFVFFAVYFFFVENVDFWVTFINLGISLSTVYLSHILRQVNSRNTVSYRVLMFYKDIFSEVSSKGFDENNIQVKVIRNLGYVFSYRGKQILYTSSDDSIFEYSGTNI